MAIDSNRHLVEEFLNGTAQIGGDAGYRFR